MQISYLCIVIIAFCIIPTLQQGWSPPAGSVQPTWQGQAQPPTQQAQPQQWNQQQQPTQQQWAGQQPDQQPQPTKQEFRGSGVGVRMLSIRAGDGKTFPSMGQNVTVHYTGKLFPSGQQFDSSVERGKPFTFTLGVGQVIRGWDIAVAHLTLGQKARFTVGPEYAYGPEGIKGSIPPNAILMFDIELLSIQ